jgi:hypothetical protein
VTPSHGPLAGGTSVQISGSGLSGATAVHFGTHVAKFHVVNDKTINATAPPHAAGTVHVTVRTPNGPSPKTTADDYRYGKIKTTTSVTWTPRHPSRSHRRVAFLARTEAASGAAAFAGHVTFLDNGQRFARRAEQADGTVKVHHRLQLGLNRIVIRYSGDANHRGSRVVVKIRVRR